MQFFTIYVIISILVERERPIRWDMMYEDVKAWLDEEWNSKREKFVY